MSAKYEVLTDSEREGRDPGFGHPNGGLVNGRKANGSSGSTTVQSVDEEMQQLIRIVFMASNEDSPRAVVFCGVDAQSASSSICARVGRALAASNQGRVCLVDANVRSPRLSALFDGAMMPKGATSTRSIVEQCAQVEGNLWLAGPALLTRQRAVLPPAGELEQLLHKLRAAFDYVLIDAPEVGARGDAQLVGAIADGAILVIEANSTRRLAARNAQQNLTAAGVRVVGAVLENRTFPIPESLYRRI